MSGESRTAMTCAEFEILYCDYVDGVLRDPEKTLLEQHLSTCAACAEMARDIDGAVSFIATAERVEPPAELLTRILHAIPAPKVRPETRSWFRRIFGGITDKVLQPRFAMGMAMTMLSFAMLVKFTGIRPRPIRPADLDPAKIWVALDDRAHRTWDRAVKYYDNMRLVIEVQSRLKEWSEQDQEQRTLQHQKESAPKERQK